MITHIIVKESESSRRQRRLISSPSPSSRQPTIYLIEVKDPRGYRIEYKEHLGDLALEVGHKVRDTLAGVIGGLQNGDADDWEIIVRRLANPKSSIRVVLWLEEDDRSKPRGRGQQQRFVVLGALRKRLRWLTTKVFVASQRENPIPDLVVRGMPRSGKEL